VWRLVRRVCAGVAIPNEEFWVSWVSKVAASLKWLVTKFGFDEQKTNRNMHSVGELICKKHSDHTFCELK